MNAKRKRQLRFLHTVPYLLPERVFLTTAPYARRFALVLTARKTPGGYYTDFVPLFGRWPNGMTKAIVAKGSRIKNLSRHGLVETSRPEIVHVNISRAELKLWPAQ